MMIYGHIVHAHIYTYIHIYTHIYAHTNSEGLVVDVMWVI
jgi:hypothetical protein